MVQNIRNIEVFCTEDILKRGCHHLEGHQNKMGMRHMGAAVPRIVEIPYALHIHI